MAKVIVTGTAGFIGFHVCKELLSTGNQVVGLDSFNDYYPVAIKDRRDGVLGRCSNYASKKMDVFNRKDIIDLIDSIDPDVVCHLAAQAGVRHSITHPFDYLDSNVVGFLNVLEGCRRARKKPRLVYASSSSVYGGIKELPFSEEMEVNTPISLYAASKKSNELMAHCYSHLYDMQCIGLRFFTVYGPFGRPDMMMWIFAEAISEGRPIKVFNNGKMRRSFSYIDDIVEGVEAAIFSKELGKYEVFNLGNDQCNELMYVVSLLEKELDRKAEIEYLPLQPGDIPAAWADVSLAREKLGFKPETTSIEVGIKSFVDWFKENPDLVKQVSEWRKSKKMNTQ